MVSHFTQFAVLSPIVTTYEPAPVVEPEPEPVPVVDPEPEPVPVVEPEPVGDDFQPLTSATEETERSGSSGNPWMIIIPVIAVLVFGLLVFFTMKRRGVWP